MTYSRAVRRHLKQLLLTVSPIPRNVAMQTAHYLCRGMLRLNPRLLLLLMMTNGDVGCSRTRCQYSRLPARRKFCELHLTSAWLPLHNLCNNLQSGNPCTQRFGAVACVKALETRKIVPHLRGAPPSTPRVQLLTNTCSWASAYYDYEQVHGEGAVERRWRRLMAFAQQKRSQSQQAALHQVWRMESQTHLGMGISRVQNRP